MKRNDNGQALFENVIMIPLIAIVIFMTAWFGRVLLARQQLIIAARYGTDLMINTELDENMIRAEIERYLCSKDIKWRRLDRNKLKVNIRMKSGEFSGLYGYYGGTDVDRFNSFVELSYNFDVPGFQYFGKGFSGSRKIAVSGRSEVMAFSKTKQKGGDINDFKIN